MKPFALLIILFLVTSCGSSKKAVENTEVKKPDSESQKPSGEIKKDIDFMIKGDIAVEDIDPKVIVSDSISITEVEAIPKKVDDSIEFIKEMKFTFNHSYFNELLKTNVSEHGNVNYKNIKNNRENLNRYIESITKNLPKDSWSKNDKLAYWINAYNALTIDLILRNYPLKSIKDIKDPWDQRLWKFGDKWLNLNHIEHNILRKMDEPRIHFAIVCASYSCPKLQNTAFEASNLDAQLTKATKEFLSDSSRNKISENKIELSKIFKWFAKDFKTDGSLINFLNKYADVEISSKAKKTFMDYNWDLND